MKKIIFIMILLLPFIVSAEETSCPIVVDTSTEISRSLTCDANNMTTTTYTEKNVEVLKNDVCTITCNEEIVFSIDPIKKVLAGMGFNYPLYVSGKRKCTAEYNYIGYESMIKKLVDEYKSLTGTDKVNKKNELTNYYEQKKECDEFSKIESEKGKKHKYKLSADVNLKLENSIGLENIKYQYKEKYYRSRVSNTTEVEYNACNFNDTNNTCKGANKTISKWIETAEIFGKYTMADTYVEAYSGEVFDDTNKADKKYYCNAEDRYFTSFDELTKPIAGDKKDEGYKLTLTAKNLGNNLSNKGDQWSLIVNCSYKVSNLFTPSSGTIDIETPDDNYDDYGNQAFLYRTIDLKKPFPNDREKGANWSGININTIIKDNKTTSNLERFVITLSSSNIKSVKEFNETNNYNAFMFDYDTKTGKEKSFFIEKFNSFIKIK